MCSFLLAAGLRAQLQALDPSYTSREAQDSLALRLSSYVSAAAERHATVKRETLGPKYAEILSHVLSGDGTFALLSYVKARLHAVYSFPHDILLLTQRAPGLVLRDPFVYSLPGGRMLVLSTGMVQLWQHEEWDFGPDPWRREP
jgi:hypothetical protein